MRYSSGMKAAIVKRVLHPNGESVTAVSRETGVSTATIHYWKKQADTYREDPVALRLQAMNMVYEGIITNGGLVLVPSEALTGMNLDMVLGAKA